MSEGPVAPMAMAAVDASAALWRVPLGLLSPAGGRGCLAILIFHRVHAQPDALFPGEMHAATFRARLDWVRRVCNVLPLGEAVDRLAERRLPSRALAITFDDGYADNATVALPILRELGIPATFFVATGFLDGGRMWNDTVIEAVRRTRSPQLDLGALGLPRVDVANDASRRTTIAALLPALKRLPSDARQASVDRIAEIAAAELPDDLMMTAADVRKLAAAGMGVGAHTITHPILSVVDDVTARREMASSREALERLLGERVRFFAYPNGKPTTDYRKRHVALAREVGFDAAFSTAPGAGRAGDSPFELPRFTPWDRTPLRWGARLARNYLVPVERAAA